MVNARVLHLQRKRIVLQDGRPVIDVSNAFFVLSAPESVQQGHLWKEGGAIESSWGESWGDTRG
jgi:hypothetical protein